MNSPEHRDQPATGIPEQGERTGQILCRPSDGPRPFALGLVILVLQPGTEISISSVSPMKFVAHGS